MRIKLGKNQNSTCLTMKSKRSMLALMIGSGLLLGILIWSHGDGLFNRHKEVKYPLNESEKLFFMKQNVDSTPKLIISYVHYLNTHETRTVQNFRYFMHFAHEPCNPDVDFVITLNVDSTSLNGSIFETKVFMSAFSEAAHLEKFKWCQDERNPRRNTYVIVRQNKAGGDLCANVDLVKSDFWHMNKAKYIYYFFINSSSRGPFLPNYWTRKW